MKNANKLIGTAIAGVLALGGTSAMTTATAAAPEIQKCYGVAKAGKNDCQTVNSACAGTSKTDGQKDAWIYVPKGTCEKLAGGSTSSS
ncbi:MAG: DUF2282 domain-containing protein [Gammaproteobacteria bacterium]|jgi:uncharacterized membrane protein|nr:DUF2282 domain-containing protein [Gammaproteobacteria bacterium]